MNIRIAQASSSETYTKYGKAPNQRRTGATVTKPEGNLDGELNVIEFKGGWECVYRPKDSKVAEYIAAFMYSAVANGSHIGYSQDATRVGVFDECAKMTLPNPAQINTLVNCDCATLVGAAIYYSGIKLSTLRKLCTWEMEEVLMGSGQFIKLTDKALLQSATGIKRGDILWKTGHTAVAIDSDSNNTKKDFGVRDLNGDSYYLYSSKGTSTYTLENDMTYLVTYTQRNATSDIAGAAWIISTNRNASNIFALKSSTITTATISGLTLKINRGTNYGRVTITRLS